MSISNANLHYMKQITIKGQHWYQNEATGLTLPSVTNILSVCTSPRLLKWQLKQAKEDKKVSEKSLDIGTKVHHAIEDYIKKSKVPKLEEGPLEFQSSWKAFSKWIYDKNPKLLDSEVTVVSKKYGYAGTLDQLAIVNYPKMALLDWKSSEHISTVYWLQLAALAGAAIECGYPVEEVGIVRLDKFLEEYEEVIVPYDSKLLDTFLSVKSYWEYVREYEGRGSNGAIAYTER